MAIKAVIVDLGGVVAREPTAEAFERVRTCCRLAADGFEDAWYRQ